jgi:thiol-disulfide isomerase/thioredoxin
MNKIKGGVILFSLIYSMSSSAQAIQSVSFNELKGKLDSLKGNVIVMNFWSTWCVPCVQELPEFEKINADYGGKKVKVLLVNLDFNSKVQTAVEPFIKKNGLKATLFHITDSDANQWIDKVDDSWSGTIPATVIYEPEGKKVYFQEGQMTYEQLSDKIKPFLTKQ